MNITALNPFIQSLKTNKHSFPMFGQSGRYVSFEATEATSKKGSVSQLMETLFSGDKQTPHTLDFHA